MSAQEKPRDTSSGEPGAEASRPGPANERPITIGKAVIPRKTDEATVLAEVFTMTIGAETIHLLPLKNWTQLDFYKWRVRGVLPRSPAGLEITWDHLKVGGETVSPWDPDACARLEKAFNEWLALEQQTLELAKEKAQAPKAKTSPGQPEEDAVHFEVEIGTAGKPLLKCLEGRDTVKVVALNLQGLNALIEEGLMRRPQTLKVGALHDWVELDGELYRLKEGTNGTRELEKALNQRYVVTGEEGAPQDVEVFANPASPTGFDIQFTASPNGLVATRKWHLNEETVQLLQDPQRCRVLRKGMTTKLTPPNLVFKLKTPDGGERYLDPGPDTTVVVAGEDGQTKTIDLSQPVSLLNVGARELTAVFNHPAINRRARLAQTGGAANQH